MPEIESDFKPRIAPDLTTNCYKYNSKLCNKIGSVFDI
jgi:hypothetical protein